METAKLKKYAQFARRSLMEQVSGKLKLVLATDSAARREYPQAVQELEGQIAALTEEQVVEKVAYTWFNRFCALRFMDVNRYNRVGLVSPAEGQFQPEILAEAKMGHIDEAMVPEKTRKQIFALLEGTTPSQDPQTEAYRLLLVAACNDYHQAMPYLFQRIDDYTELLMPDDLLSGNSILTYTREALTPETCEDVEVIGWLYQFYISEKKDQVFDGLKKNKKITPENIPAATQLFTPHWIVRYLVENSLGRLWMLNRPQSKLIDQMDYYIQPEEPETDFLKISSPEEIKICDPACGSGHMLTYAFDLLHAIYEEEGFEPAEITEKILTHNLYGIEIDERAGELAAFALTMKACARQRRFLRKPVQPNVCVLENVQFEEGELTEYLDFVGRDLFTLPLKSTLRQFEEADNFGSLIRPKVTDVEEVLKTLEAKDLSEQLLLSNSHPKVLKALKQADYLSPKYHVVIANPPYMGGKGMNGRLGAWAKENYSSSKSDLFAMFIERGLELVPNYGYSAMVTMQSWMFLSSYETLRSNLVVQASMESMVHMANMVMGIAFGTSATVWKVGGSTEANGAYCYVEYEDIGEGNSPTKFPPENERNKGALSNTACSGFYRASAADFKKIPGSPIAYWIGQVFRDSFKCQKLKTLSTAKQGLATGDNDRFLRYWHEVSYSGINYLIQNISDSKSMIGCWVPYSKGGSYRKWFGNNDYVVQWIDGGEAIRNFKDENGNERSRFRAAEYYFKPAITWSLTSSNSFGCRFRPAGFVFDINGMSLFPDARSETVSILALLNSKVANHALSILNPTMAFQVGDVSSIPVVFPKEFPKNGDVENFLLVEISRKDWNSTETSWEFACPTLLQYHHRNRTLRDAYQEVTVQWRKMTQQMRRLEEENNRNFIEAYGLQDELPPDVPVSEITLTCNPHYRYGGNKSDEELEALLLADTMREFISYAVGCMFGRYALDKPGLILANQGEGIADFVRKVTSDQGPVASEGSANHGSEELQGPDCVAEGDGLGGDGIPGDQAVPERGALRANQSGASGGGVDSVQHSGGAGAAIHGGVQKLPFDSAGIAGGSGDSTTDSNAPRLSNAGAASPHHGGASRSQQNAPGPDGKTGHWPLDTSHLSFVPDEDNVIPMLDGDWFTDDITERFYQFLRVTFGEEHYEENLRFIEEALGKDIRKFFLKDFYTDHVKRYKKRPIYWLFSSPKGSFNALIYMHRYRPDTVSVVLNDYLREFRTKLHARKDHLESVSISASATQADKTKALKEIEKLNKMIEEMEDYERDILYPLATEQVEIDLDDGVKVNYPKFGAALKKITGLSVN